MSKHSTIDRQPLWSWLSAGAKTNHHRRRLCILYNRLLILWHSFSVDLHTHVYVMRDLTWKHLEFLGFELKVCGSEGGWREKAPMFLL